MATGAGLDAQVGFKAESTWGTAVTVDKFVEFSSEDLKFDPNWLEPTGLRPGTKYKRASRVRQSRKGVTGSLTLEHATLGMGTLWKYALASGSGSTPVLISGTAYKQIHTPGDFRTLGLTVQVGRPEPGTGTVRPHTFAGVKVIGIPPCGRIETRTSGRILWPGSGSRVAPRTSVARIATASIIAKVWPMQTRGPAPNGR